MKLLTGFLVLVIILNGYVLIDSIINFSNFDEDYKTAQEIGHEVERYTIGLKCLQDGYFMVEGEAFLCTHMGTYEKEIEEDTKVGM